MRDVSFKTKLGFHILGASSLTLNRKASDDALQAGEKGLTYELPLQAAGVGNSYHTNRHIVHLCLPFSAKSDHTE